MAARRILGATLALALVVGCSEPDVILSGERLDLRAGMSGDVAESANRALPFAAPAAQNNASFTHRGGSAQHLLTHPALGGALQQVFSVSIGQGDTRRARITADPVISDGRVFTIDAGSTVAATTVTGAPLWTYDVTPVNDGRGDASGGGLAVQGGTVYVTTGFGSLFALDAATGAERWRQELDAPGGSAPTVRDDLVYVVARDSRAWAVDTGTGRVRWTLTGTPSTASFSGGAGVAVTDDIAVFPFPSGEVVGAFPQGGARLWSTIIGGARPGQAGSLAANDISADPVIRGDTVFVGNVSGRVVALQTVTGNRIWTASEGATSPVLPVGDSVFFMNDINQLIRVDAASGSVIWRQPLPLLQERAFLGRRTPRFVHYGPILAGGRLIVASSDGLLRQFDPASGASLGTVALPGGAATHPVVANGMLYVVTQNGQLTAFR